MRLAPRTTLALAALAGAAGCLEAIAPEVGPPNPVHRCGADTDPVGTVSYTNDIAPLFAAACHGCHREGGEGQLRSGLDLETYTGLRAGGSRSMAAIIVEGDPCSSVLWQKVSPSPPFGDRMPKDAVLPLSDVQIGLINDWIAEGARE